ncbi:protoglobin domain-containing protein [Nannocystis bainbridge]|uniref:Protoglobin domain-containing protein n=1 Tax=Nannocystis bainbridge TaxID=2995303 RepID=A0ABT5E388_9BACT|nr:protoglobin domain-containing protein [Nannocystis bainbridge]MDC0720334.1 protoglobin domain-containing protein [Nannocystis bainbridge]
MTDASAIYAAIQQFIGFDADDAARLRELAPLFAEHGSTLTDRFYAKLAADPEQSALIAGRVESLRQTHMRWLSELFAGDYGERYFDDRWRIGLAHVRVGVRPWWVEAVTSFLRSEGLALIEAHVADPERRAASARSLLKILDLDLMIINLAYADDRVDRLCRFTGMSRKLIERCIAQGR